MKRILLALCALIFISVLPSAASATTCSGGTPANTCYWIGGTGTWDNASTSHWSFTTGGATCSCLPSASTDKVVFDGSSGGGTVTVDSTVSGSTFSTLTMGAFTGTLDFNAGGTINTTWTSVSITGAGARTLNMGSGTWTLTATTGTVWDATTITSLTLNSNSSTILLSAVPTGTRSFIGGNTKTYNNFTVTNAAFSNQFGIDFNSGGSVTFNNMTLTNVGVVRGVGGGTMTISGTLSFDGNSTNQANFSSALGTTMNLSVAGSNTLNWLFMQGIVKAGAGSITCNNCFNGGTNTGVTINVPSNGGGGGKVIGG